MGWAPVQHPASEGVARVPGPWATLAGVLILTWLFSFFGKATVPHARLNMSDLLPGTQIVLSLCPASHTHLPSQQRTCCLGRPEPSDCCCLRPHLCPSRSPGTMTWGHPTYQRQLWPPCEITFYTGHPPLQQASSPLHLVPVRELLGLFLHV